MNSQHIQIQILISKRKALKLQKAELLQQIADLTKSIKGCSSQIDNLFDEIGTANIVQEVQP